MVKDQRIPSKSPVSKIVQSANKALKFDDSDTNESENRQKKQICRFKTRPETVDSIKLNSESMSILKPAQEITNQSLTANRCMQIKKPLQDKINDSPSSPLASQNQAKIQASINPFTPTHPYSFKGAFQNISKFPKITHLNDTNLDNKDMNIESNTRESRRLPIKQFNVSRYCLKNTFFKFSKNIR